MQQLINVPAHWDIMIIIMFYVQVAIQNVMLAMEDHQISVLNAIVESIEQ